MFYNPYLSGQSIKYSSPYKQNQQIQLDSREYSLMFQNHDIKLQQPVQLEKKLDSSYIQTKLKQQDSEVFSGKNQTQKMPLLSQSAIIYQNSSQISQQNPRLEMSLNHPTRKIFQELKIPKIKRSIMITQSKSTNAITEPLQKKQKIFEEFKKPVLPQSLIKFQTKFEQIKNEDEEFKEFEKDINEEEKQSEKKPELTTEIIKTQSRTEPPTQLISQIKTKNNMKKIQKLLMVMLPIIFASVYYLQSI